MGAVLAPQLTRCGVLGNRTFLDGPRGFWVMGGSGRFDERVLVEGLGERYHLEEVALKPFACCR
ncbi:MAG: hypothetical protein HYV93_16200 [Candidatus Rokubacteria bacterium]|nr:hypothetical protein [Candidatus Rokubacteria bacterium]